MKKHLEPGESHYWRPKFFPHLVFVDYRQLDGVLKGVHAVDEADALDWIAAKRAADLPKPDYRALTAQRERREATNATT